MTSKLLYWMYLASLVLSVAIIVKIIVIQTSYKPTDEMLEMFGTVRKSKVEVPERGRILSHDGQILAMSTKVYQMHIDCEAMLKEHGKMKPEEGKKKEAEWQEKCRAFADSIAVIFPEKSGDDYFNMFMRLRNGRDANGKKFRGRRDTKLGDRIDYQTLKRVQSFPLISEGRNYSGVWSETIEVREYPYGSLARTAIGKVVSNNPEVRNDRMGIEGKYNFRLHGTDGKLRLKKTDQKQYIPDESQESIPAVNGEDVRTTIDVQFQSIADQALRHTIEDDPVIEGGCVIIMEVSTGAIRAMVNLQKDKNGRSAERFNYAIRQACSPGSIFKAVTTTALIDDGKINLDTRISTDGGNWSYKGQPLTDSYITRGKYPEGYITVREGLAISSNNVFRKLAAEHYGSDPEKFIAKIEEYKLMEKFDFDIEGLASPYIRRPSMGSSWSPSDLPQIGMGYSLRVTPLHMITFYNAIANDGMMMKPYMVESFEKDGEIILKREPEVVVGSICKPETARMVRDGLEHVTHMNYVGPAGASRHGTGYSAFKGAPYNLVGKTGTAQIEFEFKRGGKSVWARFDDAGRHVHQGSFIGIFPKDNPKYTIMAVTWTKPTTENRYGARSAGAVREIADKIYDLCPELQTELKAQSSVAEYFEQ